MANINLSEYINTCRLDPYTVNEGTWYARGTIHHSGRTYNAGMKLPVKGDDNALTNGDVAGLLEVNALTSVAPTQPEQAPQTTTPQGGNTGLPEGAHIDENGNTVDANGNIIKAAEPQQ